VQSSFFTLPSFVPAVYTPYCIFRRTFFFVCSSLVRWGCFGFFWGGGFGGVVGLRGGGLGVGGGGGFVGGGGAVRGGGDVLGF